MKNTKYTYWDAVFLFDDTWHVVNENEYNENGQISHKAILCRCDNKEDAEKIMVALNKLEDDKNIGSEESKIAETPNPIVLRDSIMRELENIRKALDESIEGKIIEYMNKHLTQ